jgi:hypothetical protein
MGAQGRDRAGRKRIAAMALTISIADAAKSFKAVAHDHADHAQIFG